MAGRLGSSPTAGGGVVLENEFAAVRVSVDHAGNGPRLHIEDLRNGHELYVDPFMLSCLAATEWSELVPLADPGVTSWGGRQGGSRLRSVAPTDPESRDVALR